MNWLNRRQDEFSTVTEAHPGTKKLLLALSPLENGDLLRVTYPEALIDTGYHETDALKLRCTSFNERNSSL
jgi:hypothetical protein